MPAYTTENGETGSRRQLAWAAGFLTLAFLLYYLPVAAQRQISAVVRATALRPFVMTQEALAEGRIRRSDLAAVLAQKDSLAAWAANQTTLVEENRRLRNLLGLESRLGPGYVAASVLRPGVAGAESMFLLDVGSREGVQPNAPVMVDGGLVGLVREVAGSSAIGMDWTHPDFRASVMTVDGRVYGLVQPDRGAFREVDRLVLIGTPYYEDLTPGTPVLTSGLGGVYPRGIPVGTVEALAEAEAAWQKSYWIRPAVPPGSVTHVLVKVAGPGGQAADLRPIWFPEGGVDGADGVGGAGSGDGGSGPGHSGGPGGVGDPR